MKPQNFIRRIRTGASAPRLTLGLLSLFVWTLTASAQYSIDWFTIDGGGGTSTGGVYSVSGTIGQPDAGVMANGNYTLVGGFWGIVAAVQTPGAPLLTVVRSGSDVKVSWPFPSTDFVLQSTTGLATPPMATIWGNFTVPAAVHTGNDWVVTIPLPPGNRYFRLRHP